MRRHNVHHRGITVRAIYANSPGEAASIWARRDDAMSRDPKILIVEDTETGVATKWRVTSVVTYTAENQDES